MKKFLQHFINVIAILLLCALSGVYVWVSSVLMTAAINGLRLDTYIGLETGFAIVLLVFFLLWAPIWFIGTYTQRC